MFYNIIACRVDGEGKVLALNNGLNLITIIMRTSHNTIITGTTNSCIVMQSVANIVLTV